MTGNVALNDYLDTVALKWLSDAAEHLVTLPILKTNLGLT